MTAPEKPWEEAIDLQEKSNMHLGQGVTSTRFGLNSNLPNAAYNVAGPVRTSGLPPLPPRPPLLTVGVTRPMFGGGGMAPNMWSSGYGGYGNYGGYSSYGNYSSSMLGGGYGGYGFGSYGHQTTPFDNRFLQSAEESSRNAFQSIESLVRAFTSVSMMLESTYHAMYSSFRAVLGVVDNFSRLRQLMAQLLSAVTLLRIIKSFYRRLLYWLGVLDHNPQSEQVWEAVNASVHSSQVATSSSWPLFTFIGLLVGGPYLISKLFSSVQPPEEKKWDPKQGKFCKALYPHKGASENELSFNENEILNIAPKELQLPNGNGWLLASNREGRVGYVPYTRLQMQNAVDLLAPRNPFVPSSSDNASAQTNN